jgi:ribose transport system substrate-binding protein
LLTTPRISRFRSAYERIRAGNQYQQVTVSEPHPEQGYQVIDEFSRAFSGQPPSGWHQRPYLVTPQNVDAEGGKQNRFIPSNGFAEQYQKLWGLK